MGQLEIYLALLCWKKLGHLPQIVDRDHGELLVQLQLGLGHLGEVDDHQQVPHVAVQHYFKLVWIHLRHGLHLYSHKKNVNAQSSETFIQLTMSLRALPTELSDS